MKQLHNELVGFLLAVLEKLLCLIIVGELDKLRSQNLRYQMCLKAVPLYKHFSSIYMAMHSQ